MLQSLLIKQTKDCLYERETKNTYTHREKETFELFAKKKKWKEKKTKDIWLIYKKFIKFRMYANHGITSYIYVFNLCWWVSLFRVNTLKGFRNHILWLNQNQIHWNIHICLIFFCHRNHQRMTIQYKSNEIISSREKKNRHF